MNVYNRLLEEQTKNGFITVYCLTANTTDVIRDVVSVVTPENVHQSYPILRQLIDTHIRLINEGMAYYGRLLDILYFLLSGPDLVLYPLIVQVITAIKEHMDCTQNIFQFPAEFIHKTIQKYDLAFVHLLYDCKFDLHDLVVPLLDLGIKNKSIDICTQSIDGILNSDHIYSINRPNGLAPYDLHIGRDKYIEKAIDAGDPAILDLIISHLPYPSNEEVVDVDMFNMLLYRTEPDSVRLPIIETLYARGAFRSLEPSARVTRSMFADIPDSRALNRLIEIINEPHGICTNAVDVRTTCAA